MRIIGKLYPLVNPLINNRATAALVHRFMGGRFSRHLIPAYCRFFSVATDEAEFPPEHYPTLQAFFTRRLKEGARPVTARPEQIVSPVDGKLSAVYEISEALRFTVKGQELSLGELLADAQLAQTFKGGLLYLFYLSPADYHRLHLPLAGRDLHCTAQGRRSYPVNDFGLRYGKRPLVTNHRLLHRFESQEQAWYFIPIGAQNVNSIVRTLPDATRHPVLTEYGYFALGSSVILLFPPELPLATIGEWPRPVKVGDPVGRLLPEDGAEKNDSTSPLAHS